MLYCIFHKHTYIKPQPTSLLSPPLQHAWLNQTKLVVKPDMLFGQRGKNDLVGLNLTYPEAEEFIKARMGKQV
jgi:ATP citrate (pro-S)-lyase